MFSPSVCDTTIRCADASAFSGVTNEIQLYWDVWREAEVLASLNHPGIAAIYGIEEDEAEGTRALVLARASMPRSALRTSTSYAPESKDTVLDRGMSREIGAQAERVRTPIEFAEALKDADGPRGVEAGCTHESEA